MKARKDLKLKYLTGVYRYMEDGDSETDSLYMLVEDIKSARRSKKNWTQSDFVFTKEQAEKTFGGSCDDKISMLQENGYIGTKSDFTYYITDSGLSLFFEF